MKLYTYTAEHSLPRMALKGMPDGFVLIDDLSLLGELMSEQSETEKAVALEVDISGIEDAMLVSPDTVENVALDAARDAEAAGEDEEAAYSQVYNADLSTLEKAIDLFGEVENNEIIPASRITVLGRLESLEFPNGIDEPAEVKFKGPPKPLKAFQQPFVTRILRSIFLPRHKLYGAGKRSPSMGFISRFFPKLEADDVDEPPPDIVGDVPLVWAAGKTFRRGMRGAFGGEAGDAIGQMISMRAGQEPGKYLGSGAKGAVYALSRGLVLKVTMDGNEIYAAANLIGVRHPNLSLVHDVFIVTDGEKGVGIIVRDSVDTTLDKFDPMTSAALDSIMDEVLDSAVATIAPGFARIEEVDLAREVKLAIKLLRKEGCKVDEQILLDVADAFRELQHLGILGIDFDSKNIGVIRKPTPRTVIFDYGMTKSPPVEVEVVSLESVRA